MNERQHQQEQQNSYANAAQGLMHVFIRDLTLPMSVGIYDHEKTELQPVRFNVSLAVAANPTPESGTSLQPSHMHDFVCYKTISDNIKAHIKDTHFDLLETLAETIAQNCLEDQRIIKVKIKVEKTTAIPETASVGIEIEHTRATH